MTTTLNYNELRKRLKRYKALAYTDINCKGIQGKLHKEYHYIVSNYLKGDPDRIITFDDLKFLLEAQGYRVYTGDHKRRGFYLNGVYNKKKGSNNNYHSFRDCLELMKDYL